jgi:hypothetical protein
MSNSRKNIDRDDAGTTRAATGMVSGSKGSSMKRSTKGDTSDFLLLMTPTDGRHPGKRFEGESCEKVKPARGQAPMGYKLRWSKVEAHDGRSLARAVRGIGIAGDSYILRSDVVSPRPAAVICRTKCFDPAKPYEPVTITGAGGRRWGMLDLDAVNNLLGVDPRRNPAKAVDFLLSLLPPVIGAADLGIDWSSSLCVGLPKGTAPTELRAHVWMWLDTALNEDEWKALLVRIRAYFIAKLIAKGAVEVAPGCVDVKVSECQQPLFVSQPLFHVDGRYRGDVDPFQFTRYRQHRGGSPSVSVSRLEQELAADEATRPVAVATPRKPKKSAGATTPSAKSARQPKAEPRNPAPSVVPLALVRGARDALAAAAEVRAFGEDSYRDRCDQLFIHRALLEIHNVVIYRRENGDADPRWAAWSNEGGVPEGQRSVFAAMVASLVVEAAPLCLPIEDVPGRVMGTLRMLMDGAWVDAEWVGCKFESSVMTKYGQAAVGEKDKFGRDARYHYRKSACARIVDVQDDEVVALGLRSLATTERSKSALRREIGGAQVRSDYTDEVRRHDVRIAELIVAGNTVSAIARILGLSRGKLIYTVARAEVQTLVAEMKATVAEQVTADVVAIAAKPTVAASERMVDASVSGTVVSFTVPVRPKKPSFAGWSAGAGVGASNGRIPLTA